MTLFKAAIQKNYIGILLLFVFISLGFLTYQNYGISWDEPQQRVIGITNANYVLSGDKNIETFKDRDHGVAFELFLFSVEKVFKPESSKAIYFLRHITTHLFFLMGCFVFFLLINNLFKNQIISAIGFLMFVLTPTIYGHSFFNSKDIPFLTMIPLCLYFAERLFNKYELKYFIISGISCAFFINIRVLGIIFPFFTLLLLFFNYCTIDKTRNNHLIKGIGIFIITLLVILYISWPYLWNDPLRKFIYVFRSMAKFNWGGYVLFNGNMIKSTELPWNYAITWFLINNPIYYLLLFFWGLIIFTVNIVNLFIENKKLRISEVLNKLIVFFSNNTNKIVLLCVCIFLGSFLSVILLHSVLYDSWRHLFYVYPLFLVIAVYGLNALSVKGKLIRILSYFLTAVSVICISFFMVKNYPYFHVYFNEFVSRKPEYLRTHYELDYWGASGKQAIEYILRSDKSKVIKIAFRGLPSNNVMMAQESDINRIKVLEDVRDADYLITNYRGTPDLSPPYPNVFTIKVLNSSIISVYKIKKED
jgi:hypothetical protein